MEELIVRHLQGRTDHEEESRLGTWRSESAENERLFQELARVWGALSEVDIDTMPPLAAILARTARPSLVPSGGRIRPRRRGWVRGLAVAASIGFLVVAGDYVRREVGARGRTLESAQLATGDAKTALAHLSDGTIVHLAPNSRLVVSPVPGRREVWLEGRAFFGVAKHGQDWPFVVRSRAGEAHVLGTRFEFSTEKGGVRVVVVEGRVAFSAAGQNVEVSAGQMSEALPDSGPTVRAIQDVDATLEWMGRALVFRETPLADATHEIEARYGATIEIRDPALAGETITGGFEDRSFADVVHTICRVLSADCSVEESHAVISTSPRPD